MEKSVVVIIGKNAHFCQNLISCGHFSGVRFLDTPDGAKGIRIVREQSPTLVIITSCSNPAAEELKTVTAIRKHNGDLPIFFVSENSSEELIIAAFRAGVSDFFRPPLIYSRIAGEVKKILEGGDSGGAAGEISAEKGECPPMIGKAKKMRDVRTFIENVGPLDTTVFITGETGTGKGLVALLIHRASRRHNQQIVSVNCAALPDNLVESELFGYEKGAFTGAEQAKMGRFEMANGGTLFLDEIGDMSPYAQAKVLKVIEEQENTRLGAKSSVPLDIRLIAATNVEPEDLLATGNFRKDLYYRINVARIHLPPLRERKEDIPRLISHCLLALNSRYGRRVCCLDDEAINALLRYDWPGNVRELKNLLESAFVNTGKDTITLADLPPVVREEEQSLAPGSQRDKIISVLEATNWNKTRAASKMNCSRMTLYRKMAKYNLA